MQFFALVFFKNLSHWIWRESIEEFSELWSILILQIEFYIIQKAIFMRNSKIVTLLFRVFVKSKKILISIFDIKCDFEFLQFYVMLKEILHKNCRVHSWNTRKFNDSFVQSLHKNLRMRFMQILHEKVGNAFVQIVHENLTMYLRKFCIQFWQTLIMQFMKML